MEFFNVKNLAVHEITKRPEKIFSRFKICSDVTLIINDNCVSVTCDIPKFLFRFGSGTVPTAHTNPQYHRSHIFGKQTDTSCGKCNSVWCHTLKNAKLQSGFR